MVSHIWPNWGLGPSYQTLLGNDSLYLNIAFNTQLIYS